MSTYSSAASHYLSARRRDPVKVLMEEVVTRRLFGHAVNGLRLPPGAPLRVLDIGCGTADGLRLLRHAADGESPVAAGLALDYVGLDADAAMVETARSLYPEPGVRFVEGDARAQLPDEDFDLYLSCGVPYSHLTGDETTDVLTAILRRAASRTRPSAVVVDVLGRYSVEWTPQWHLSRWNYAMTFFEDVDEQVEEMMTCYDRESLGAVVEQAAARAGAGDLRTTFFDRSVLLGRHTATRTFNPAIPPYRTLVNDLYRGQPSARGELRFTPPAEGAPAPILEFFRDWAREWNSIVDEAFGTSDTLGSAEEAKALATTLLDFERRPRAGLGAGHSLTAVIVVEP
ncbi:class I SAM-dependent methyltransferase [Amycolatopsis sp. NPDC058986]|uniref:class I SAM-dependent methyltransferase n=1 Tax=unclassified Amycolatopsis TaxID=2618356 RepID=UPI00367295CA